jgi:hypothetical protein
MDEFVKRLREKSEAFDYDGWVETASDYEKAADAIEGLSHAVDQMTEWRKNPWIPVTEEPPLKVGDDGYNGYLVYANGYYEVADYTTDKFDNVPYFHVNGEYEPDVTHYMPLPEPPKEET